MSAKAARALTVAGGLVAWSAFIAPRLPPRWLVPTHAALSTALAAAVAGPPGLRRQALRRGLRGGLTAAGLVGAAVGAVTPVPRVRASMAERELPAALGWLLVRIPLGTVWSEEIAYRGALGTVAEDAFGPRWGRLLQAAAFGLSHIADARGAGEPVAPTVLVTGAAGWGFAWLHARTGSVVAPMLAHLASNEAGAVAALWVQRRRA